MDEKGILPLTRGLNDFLGSAVERTSVDHTPIGLISYAYKQKFAAAMIENRGTVRTNSQEFTTDNQNHFDVFTQSYPGRVVNIDCEGAVFLQAGMGSIDIIRQHTIHHSSQDRLWSQMHLHNTTTQQYTTLPLEEAELLDFMTGKAGGVIGFTGGGSPENYAVVINKQMGGRRFAVVIFIQPDENEAKAISGEAVTNEFFHNLGSRIIEATRLPYLHNIRLELEIEVARGHVNEKRERLGILELALLGHAVASLKTSGQEQQEHLRFINQFLPEFFHNPIDRFASALIYHAVAALSKPKTDISSPTQRQIMITKTIDSHILNPTAGTPQLESNDKQLVVSVPKLQKPSEATELRQWLSNELGNRKWGNAEPGWPIYQTYVDYTRELIRLARKSIHSPKSTEEIVALLRELSNTIFANYDIYTDFREPKLHREGGISNSRLARHIWNQQVKDDMLNPNRYFLENGHSVTLRQALNQLVDYIENTHQK